MAVKKAAKTAARKVNREGQRWTDDRPGMTLRLPIDLREAVTEESRVKGDLARIVLFALSHVEREKVDIMQTRKAGMELTNPQLLHVGAEARLKLKEWAEAEGVSVNAIVVSVLEEFFKRLKKSKALREELRLEIRAHRGFEWFKAAHGDAPPTPAVARAISPPATREMTLAFFEFIEGKLDDAGFFRPIGKKPGMRRNLRNMFHRMAMTKQDVRTLWGAVVRLVDGPRVEVQTRKRNRPTKG